jgi:hypothetical protein
VCDVVGADNWARKTKFSVFKWGPCGFWTIPRTKTYSRRNYLLLFRKMIWEDFIEDNDEKETGKRKSKKKAAKDFKVTPGEVNINFCLQISKCFK